MENPENKKLYTIIAAEQVMTTLFRGIKADEQGEIAILPKLDWVANMEGKRVMKSDLVANYLLDYSCTDYAIIEIAQEGITGKITDEPYVVTDPAEIFLRYLIQEEVKPEFLKIAKVKIKDEFAVNKYLALI